MTLSTAIDEARTVADEKISKYSGDLDQYDTNDIVQAYLAKKKKSILEIARSYIQTYGALDENVFEKFLRESDLLDVDKTKAARRRLVQIQLTMVGEFPAVTPAQIAAAKITRPEPGTGMKFYFPAMNGAPEAEYYLDRRQTLALTMREIETTERDEIDGGGLKRTDEVGIRGDAEYQGPYIEFSDDGIALEGGYEIDAALIAPALL